MILFCNSNTFLTKAAHDLTINEFLDLYGSSPPSNVTEVLYGNSTNPDDVETFANDFDTQRLVRIIQNRVNDPSFNKSTLKSLGYTWDTFFTEARLGKKTLSSDFFNWYFDPVYGNCFKFNSGKMENGTEIEILEQGSYERQPGGLHTVNFIDVFPKQAYSFMNLRSFDTPGLWISIHDQNDLPLTYNKMRPFSRGRCTYVNLKKTETKNLPQPYSRCQDLTDFHSILYDKIISLKKTYSQNFCFALCKQKKLIDTCNCSVYNYPNVDNYPTCKTLDEIKCFDEEDLTTDMSECEELCPLECESTSYDFTSTFDSYPDQSTYLVKTAHSIVVDHFKNAGLSASDISYEDLSRSMVCLYVKYNELSTATIEDNKAMPLVS
jgi:hypothetical protein